MKNAIILVSLFSISVLLETPSIDFGKKILSDSSNNQFLIPYKGPIKNIYLFIINHEKEKLDIGVDCPNDSLGSVGHYLNDFGFVFYNTDGTCTLTLDVDEGDKGSFIVYDFKAYYEIKLKNRYGNIKMDVDTYVKKNWYDESMSQLNFSVPNFRTNSNITFEFVNKTRYYKNLENPFIVCHKNDCIENVTNYYFKKGESYHIYVKLLEIYSKGQLDSYLIPPFRFYAEDSGEEYSNDDITYTYNETRPDPEPHSASNYRQISLLILVLLTSLLF